MTYGTSTVVAYAIHMEQWPPRRWDGWPYDYSPAPPVIQPVVAPPEPKTLDFETSRELIEALVRQAVREHEDRIRDLEKRLAAAEGRIAELEARR